MRRVFSCSSSQGPVESWSKRDQKLLEAVEKGDVGRVAALASRKTARPAKLNAVGQSALHLAASKGLTECLTLLLAHGAPVDEEDEDGSTALHLATIACQPQCVKVLLQYGADESRVDGQNRTPLHWAAASGCASSVLLLCDHAAPLDVTDAHGQTPLMLAARGNHAGICAQLLRRGADAGLADAERRTALTLARQHGSLESAELLRSHRDHRPPWGGENGPVCAGDPAPQVGSRGEGSPGSDGEEEEEEAEGQRAGRGDEPSAGKRRGWQRVVAAGIRQRVRELARLGRERERLREELRGLREGDTRGADGDAGVLRELHRRLDGLARSQHEALQLVAAMEGDGDGQLPGQVEGRGTRRSVPRLPEQSTGTSDVTVTTSDITTTICDVTTATSDVTITTSNVTTGTSNIAITTSNVTTGTSDVTTATSNVNTGISNVTTGTSDVTITTSDITTGTSDIAITTSNVTTGTSDVTTSTSDVTITTSKVTTGTSNITLTTSTVTTGTSNVTTATSNVTITTSDVTTGTSDITTSTSGTTTGTSDVTTSSTSPTGQHGRELPGSGCQPQRAMEVEARAGELCRACRDKDGKMRKVLAEMEKLSAEVLGLRGQSARLRLQLEVQQKNHRDVIAVYRTHLLNAAQGFMDAGAHAVLLRILRPEE